MISIDIELLLGRFVATAYNRRDQAEWPPHPARLYSALVATYAAEASDAQRQALRWLAMQGPPQIVASAVAGRRTVSNVFVPVNDTRVTASWEGALEALNEAEQALAAAPERKRPALKKKVAKAGGKLKRSVDKALRDDGKNSKLGDAVALLPGSRNKQPRTFPAVVPADPVVSLVWADATPLDAVRDVLAELLRRVINLGHSSSLVACRLGDGALVAARPDDVWHPSDDGEVSLRVVTEGQLERLETAFARHQGVEPRLLPCSFQRYRLGAERGREQIPASALDGSWVVFRATAHQGGRPARLRLTRCVDLGRALRGAVLRHAVEPVPEVLSGHGADGRPIERPHVAFVSLADVYRPDPNQLERRDRSNHKEQERSKPRRRLTASGAVLGVAMLLPRGLDDDERRSVLKAVAAWEQAEQGRCRLVMGRIGELDIERLTGGDPRRTLQPSWWTAGSRRWATVTPIALDRNPGDLFHADGQVAQEATAQAEQIIARACGDIGLPAPAWVQIMQRSVHGAVPSAKAFMPFPRKRGALRRVCVHAEMLFEEPVRGPVILGAGRYFGLGLCRPCFEEAP